MRRWVIEGKTPRVLVGTQRLAVRIHDVNGGAVTPGSRGENYATLPGPVGLDGSIALADSDSSELAGGTGRGRRGDQRASRQRGSQSCDDELLHAVGTLPPMRRAGPVIGDDANFLRSLAVMPAFGGDAMGSVLGARCDAPERLHQMMLSGMALQVRRVSCAAVAQRDRVVEVEVGGGLRRTISARVGIEHVLDTMRTHRLLTVRLAEVVRWSCAAETVEARRI
jgi:hypothetical protein